MLYKRYPFRISIFSFIGIFILTTSSSCSVKKSYRQEDPLDGHMLSTYFDLEAHRGGRGLTTESTLEAFAHAIELGVTTLELDTQVTKDLHVVITHDQQILAEKCKDTQPVYPKDPQYPYVGKFIKNLTFSEIATLNCGYQQLPGFPQQHLIPHAKIPLLSELFALVKKYHSQVRMNIETKVQADAPNETVPINIFVHAVADQIKHSGLRQQITVQSFAWKTLKIMHALAPDLPLYALTTDEMIQTPGPSVWLDGINPRDYHGDLIALAQTIPGITAISPAQGNPEDSGIEDKNFVPFVTAQLVNQAHKAHILVVPWTVDDKATMSYFIHLGVDGIITDYPNLLRDIMQETNYPLPQPYHL